MRKCGDCQLCCKLVPVEEGHSLLDPTTGKRTPVTGLHKPAGERCPHQRHHKGCAIYARRPRACATWNCRWLVNNDTADMQRPDRAHYVIDILPDYVTLLDNDTGATRDVQVVQIWLDPDYPDAHRDPALRAYLERRAAEGIIGLVRLDNKRAFPLVAPSITHNGEWYEGPLADHGRPQHTAADIANALGDIELHFEATDGN